MRALSWKALFLAGCALAIGAWLAYGQSTTEANDIDGKVDTYSIQAYTREQNATIGRDQAVIVLRGAIRAPFANDLKAVLAKHKDHTRRILIDIASPGGSVAEGRAIIALLQEVRKTHDLTTRVSRGEACLSMCVPIFLQGSDRVAAKASVWMFHPVIKGANHRLDVMAWEELVDAYYLPAGVDKAWLESLRAKVGAPAEVWLTGGQLAEENSGIAHRALEDVLKLDPSRLVPTPEAIARRGKDIEAMPNG